MLLSERSQSEKAIYCMIPTLYDILEKAQSDMTEHGAAEAMTCLVLPVSEFYVNQRVLY